MNVAASVPRRAKECNELDYRAHIESEAAVGYKNVEVSLAVELLIRSTLTHEQFLRLSCAGVDAELPSRSTSHIDKAPCPRKG
jgi:hypothetical protein